jgi:glycine dehydrogenase subunit 2
MLIFEYSKSGRTAKAQIPESEVPQYEIAQDYLRKTPPRLPACSELQVVRHYTNLSRRNYAIDTNFYPLGSCTMKYNPRGVQKAASMSGFINRHPLSPEIYSQGFLQAMYDLQIYLAEITGMQKVSLTPMAGSQGEFAGVAMIKAYHLSRGDSYRDEMLIPDAAHGTNPASASMCGFKIVNLATDKSGEISLDELKAKLGPRTAGIMLTNPSTLGLFMSKIKEVADLVHAAGGLLYYDGANFNAILGKVRPGDMGFDVIHLNLHKTFATPHGGGGPGSGPVAAGKLLEPFLPQPLVVKKNNLYCYAVFSEHPYSIGRLSCFMGNAGILLRAYFYIRVLGVKGLERIAKYATLNANYLLKKLTSIGFSAAYPNRLASHEFILTLQKEKQMYGVTAMDFAKRLLDYGVHAPTTYFPLIVPECLLIEPTETESKEELDNFINVMEKIYQESQDNPELLRKAPSNQKVKRLDDVKAARELNLNYFKLS